MRLVGFALVCAATATFIPLAPRAAHACTCSAGDPRARLLAADAAAVVVAVEVPGGVTPLRAEGVTWDLEVREAIKGALPERIELVTSGSPASCGIHFAPGTEYGLFLRREGSHWTAGACSQIAPDTLRRAAQPPPRPNGSGRTAFIVAGVFGESRTLALDSELRTLHYGFGTGEALQVAVCPGARRAVELVRTPARPAPYVLGVRRLGSFALEREVPLPDLIEREGYGYSFRSLTCRDPTAKDVVVFASTGSLPANRGQVLRLGSSEKRSLWEGKAAAAAISKDGRRAFVVARDRRLSEIELDSGRAREIRLVRDEPDIGIHLSPDGGSVAWWRHGLVFVVELGSGRQDASPSEFGGVAWTPDGRIVSWGGTEERTGVRVLDAGLNTLASWSGWQLEGSTLVVGDRLYGYGHGRIRVASVMNGQSRILRRFESPNQYHLVAVPPPDSDAAAGPARLQRGLPTWAVVAALLSLVALLGAYAARLRWAA